jgi:hypothetical protein
MACYSDLIFMAYLISTSSPSTQTYCVSFFFPFFSALQCLTFLDGYKIVCFATDNKGIVGTYLDQEFLQHPERPVDQLLRWHFRQAVLTNMKGVGQPIFEHDFPPGSDVVGEILAVPNPAGRMQNAMRTFHSSRRDDVYLLRARRNRLGGSLCKTVPCGCTSSKCQRER